jgi:hypothetical protein
MRREHCESSDSDDAFTTSNYGIRTTPRIELTFVVSPVDGLAALGLETWPAETKLEAGQRRRALPPAHFQPELHGANERLERIGCSPVSEDELVSARLYTGPNPPSSCTPRNPNPDLHPSRPCSSVEASARARSRRHVQLSVLRPPCNRPAPALQLSCARPAAALCPSPNRPIPKCSGPMFVKYNSVLRGVRSRCTRQFARWYAGCKGNRYTTTIWILNSAITKLSQLTVADRVYRGVRGDRLLAARRGEP